MAQLAQDQAEIERAHVDQLPLQNVFVSAQMATPHRARFVAGREAALDELAAPLSGVLTVGQPTSGRDFFSTHFDINYLPENQARTEALWETSENGGRAACHGGRGVTFVARFFWSRGKCVFRRGSGRNPNPTITM